MTMTSAQKFWANHDERQEALENALREKLTDEFLATAKLAAETIGWGMDFIEVKGFVEELYRLAGKEPPEIRVLNPV